MQIKQHSNKNHYALTSTGLWVRDFTRPTPPIDINNLTSIAEYKTLIDNEVIIDSMDIPEIGSEFFPTHTKCVIVSDGFDFEKKKDILYNLPNDVCIIGTNRTLSKWDVNVDNTVKRRMDYFLVNNPFRECLSYLPKHKYRPKCIVSSRTYNEFIKKYKGYCYYYIPVGDKNFGRTIGLASQIDDYRNPICAAVGLAYKFKVNKLILLCCDDVFKGQRPGSINVGDDLYMYPQHKISHGLIDANLYWLKKQDDYTVESFSHSSGLEYKWAEYISEAHIMDFFNGK